MAYAHGVRPAATAGAARPGLGVAARALALVTALAASACQTDQVVTGSINASEDYRKRHPIVLAETTRNLDIFVGGTFNELAGRQRRDVHDFAGEYLHAGQGGIVILAPD